MALIQPKQILIFFLITIVITGYFSCKTEDLGIYNPILIAADERDLGNELMRTIYDNPSDYNLLDKTAYPKVYSYLNLAWTMVRNQTEIRDYYDWEVFVLHDDVNLDAYTLPGGKLGITTGMLKQMSSEPQLLAVMGHEAYYNDRINQNAVDAISKVMDRLKFMVSNNDGMGTKVFKDVINGISDMNVSMVDYCRDIEYDPSVTFEADEFMMNEVICEHAYSPMGLKSLLLEAENNNWINFHWLNARPPSISVDDDDVYTFTYRKEVLEDLENMILGSDTCNSTEEMLDTDEYIEMMEALP